LSGLATVFPFENMLTTMSDCISTSAACYKRLSGALILIDLSAAYTYSQPALSVLLWAATLLIALAHTV